MIKNFTYLFILFLFSCSSNNSFLQIKNTYENLPKKEINLLKLTSTPTINCRDNINYVDVDDFIFFLIAIIKFFHLINLPASLILLNYHSNFHME